MAELKQRQNLVHLRELTDAELQNEVAAQLASLYGLRQKNAMKQLEQTSKIRHARKQIARAKTILRERELEQQREAK